MKMMFVTALLAGTALAPAGAIAQQTPAAEATQREAARTDQADNGMQQVQEHIDEAIQALDDDDLETAREAVQQARRYLDQQAQNQQDDEQGNSVAGISQPLQEAEQALSEQDAQRAEEALSGAKQQIVAMDRPTGKEQTGADVVVQDEASILVDVPEPNITVQQANPRVAVQQQQPEITVHQPAPIVTVDIPQPEITVRMPEPDVRVSQSQPEVQVEQGQPQVRVSETEPRVQMQEREEQANVQVERSGEPVVQMQGAEQEPSLRYTSEEAQVRVTRGEGDPEVRVEQQAAAESNSNDRQVAADRQNGNAASEQQARNTETEEVDRQNTAAISQTEARDDANTAVASGSSREVAVTVGDIKNFDIVGADGNNLGDIDEVVNVDGRLYAVVTSGGFLGLGENRAAVRLSALQVTDQNTLQAPNVTERQIDGMSDFPSDRYQQLPDDHSVTLGAY